MEKGLLNAPTQWGAVVERLLGKLCQQNVPMAFRNDVRHVFRLHRLVRAVLGATGPLTIQRPEYARLLVVRAKGKYYGGTQIQCTTHRSRSIVNEIHPSF